MPNFSVGGDSVRVVPVEEAVSVVEGSVVMDSVPPLELMESSIKLMIPQVISPIILMARRMKEMFLNILLYLVTFSTLSLKYEIWSGFRS